MTATLARVAFGPLTGSQTKDFLLNPTDYSHYDQLRVTLELTAANTADGGTDTADFFFMMLGPNLQFDDRIHLTQVTGAMTPTPTAPRTFKGVIQKYPPESSSEANSEISSSSGGARLAAGANKNGPFPGKVRTKGVFNTAGVSGLQISAKFQAVVVDANSNGVFAGTLILEGDYAL